VQRLWRLADEVEDSVRLAYTDVKIRRLPVPLPGSTTPLSARNCRIEDVMTSTAWSSQVEP